MALGNKVDKESERRVPPSRAQAWTRNKGEMPLFECSAKNSTNVKEAFQEIPHRALKKKQQEETFQRVFRPVYGETDVPVKHSKPGQHTSEAREKGEVLLGRN